MDAMEDVKQDPEQQNPKKRPLDADSEHNDKKKVAKVTPKSKGQPPQKRAGVV